MATTACGVGGGDDVEEIDENPLGIQCSDAFTVSGTFTPSTARPVDDPGTPDVDETVSGCWPAGTWTFTLARDMSEDAAIIDITGDKIGDRCGEVAGTSAAQFKSSYSFTVTRTDNGDGYVDAYSHTTAGVHADCAPGAADGKDCTARLKVSEGGALECEGGLEIYSADRKMHWNLHPEQETGVTTLQGKGEFTQFINAQIP